MGKCLQLLNFYTEINMDQQVSSLSNVSGNVSEKHLGTRKYYSSPRSPLFMQFVFPSKIQSEHTESLPHPTRTASSLMHAKYPGSSYPACVKGKHGPGREEKERHRELKASLGYTVSWRLAWATSWDSHVKTKIKIWVYGSLVESLLCIFWKSLCSFPLLLTVFTQSVVAFWAEEVGCG